MMQRVARVRQQQLILVLTLFSGQYIFPAIQ